MFGQKPGFGGTSAFGTTASINHNVHSISDTAAFGAKTPTPAAFGTPSFVSSTPNVGIFGSQPASTASTNLFGTNAAGAFGQPAATSSNAFAFGGTSNAGTNMFGTPQQQQQASTGLFSLQPTTAFGAAAKPAGFSGFGTNTATGTSLFGQNKQPTLFGASTSTSGGSLFGGTAAAATTTAGSNLFSANTGLDFIYMYFQSRVTITSRKKATVKLSKYVDLQMEYQRMWNKTVEVVVGATGVVDNNLWKYLDRITGQHNIYNFQRSCNPWYCTGPSDSSDNKFRLVVHEQPTMLVLGAGYAPDNTCHNITYHLNILFIGFSQVPTQSGTTFKFSPVTGNDTMLKNGLSTNINTRLQCITTMKQYEGRSLEELRTEDYLANRKGPQAGSTTFSSTSLFGQNTAAASPASFSFGGTQTKPIFGGTATSTPSIFSQPQQPSTALFGQPATTGFGAATSTATGFGGFGTPAKPTLFGQPAVSQPSTGLFSQPAAQTNTAFGTQSFSSGFGATTQSNTLFGAKPAFGATTTTSAFNFGTNTAPSASGTSLFGQKPAGTMFNTGNATAFGNTGTGFGGFGTAAATAKPGGLFGTQSNSLGFNLPSTAPSFGNSLAGGFGTGIGATTGGSLFGNTATTKPAFNFGSTLGTGNSKCRYIFFIMHVRIFIFKQKSICIERKEQLKKIKSNLQKQQKIFKKQNTETEKNTKARYIQHLDLLDLDLQIQHWVHHQLELDSPGMYLCVSNMNDSLSQQQADVQKQLLALAATPFGDSPLFRNLVAESGKREELLKPTNPSAQKALITANQFKVSPMPKVKPKSWNASIDKKSLFDGLEDDDLGLSLSESFVPRKSVKKLILKSKSVNASNTANDSISNNVTIGNELDSMKNTTLVPFTPVTPVLTRSPVLSIGSSFHPIPVKLNYITHPPSLRFSPFSSSPICYPNCGFSGPSICNKVKKERKGKDSYRVFRKNRLPAKLTHSECNALSSLPASHKVCLEKNFSKTKIMLNQNVRNHCRICDCDQLLRLGSPYFCEIVETVFFIFTVVSYSKWALLYSMKEKDMSMSSITTPDYLIRKYTDVTNKEVCVISETNESLPSEKKTNPIADSNLNSKNAELKEKLSYNETTFDIDDEDDQSVMASPKPPHPAGIILNRLGYYTIPSLDNLKDLINSQGRCEVEQFTIGRKGYGSVFFPGTTDITDLNLDELVHIRRKEIIVYPEDSNKPEVGEGLNKKAEVTLDGIWPSDKMTHNPIKVNLTEILVLLTLLIYVIMISMISL
ncbi:Nuclear pore complex protein Nup98-Nup96 [Nymphon striatum]|nr:Nuclear pore complex protein Nup98-Nup96 [Nymphon striatum]